MVPQHPLIYNWTIKIRACTATKRKLPTGNLLSTSVFCHVCEEALKTGNTFCTNYTLRQAVIDINHGENGSIKQCTMLIGLQPMTIQLLVVSEPARCVKVL